jgi:hypothetical protein
VKNTVVFGLGRSGTNPLAETLSMTTHQQHRYLREYFSDNWALCKDEIVYAGAGALDFDTKYRYIKTLSTPWLFSCTPNSVNDQVLDLMINHADIYVIVRENLQDIFLSHVLAWFENRFYGNRVQREPASIWINQDMFDKYQAYYCKYQDILTKIKPAQMVRYEDYKFHSTQYHSGYNLASKMDYIENQQEVLDFLEKLQVSAH